MARTNVLKFGDWDTEENVPYTTYFENARVSSRDKVKSTSSSRNPDLETRKGSEAVRAKHENIEEGELHRSYDSQARLDAGRKASINSSHYQSAGVSSDTPKRAARADRGGFRSADHSPLHPHYQAKISAKGGAISSVEEEGELQRSYDSPLRLDAGRKASINSSHHRPSEVSSGKPKRAAGGNGGGFRSADHSPLHPHYQAKISAKGGAVSSPSRERKGSSEGSHGLAPSTPGRSRLRPVPRGNDTPDRGASVPKFGEWDDTDPTSADGFTHIFDKVKEERHGSIGNTSGTASSTVHSDRKKHHRSKNSKGCWCLPW